MAPPGSSPACLGAAVPRKRRTAAGDGQPDVWGADCVRSSSERRVRSRPARPPRGREETPRESLSGSAPRRHDDGVGRRRPVCRRGLPARLTPDGPLPRGGSRAVHAHRPDQPRRAGGRRLVLLHPCQPGSPVRQQEPVRAARRRRGAGPGGSGRAGFRRRPDPELDPGQRRATGHCAEIPARAPLTPRPAPAPAMRGALTLHDR